MDPVGPSEWLWKEGAGYYTHTESDLLAKPTLPNERFVRDRLMMHLFREHGRLTSGSKVLEIGCGGSSWLPYLAQTIGCQPCGIDLEPHAARLAQANLAGAGLSGQIYCRDGFDAEQNKDLWGQFDLVYSLGVIEHLEDVSSKLRVLGRFLKPGGRLISMVPNLQGLNWAMQRFGSVPVLQAHVVYTTRTLKDAHERAGFETLTTSYVGFCDGFLTSSSGEPRLKKFVHRTACRMLSLGSAAWSRAGLPTKEWRFIAPLVVYVGVPLDVAMDMCTPAMALLRSGSSPLSISGALP
jgi:2-polyprenyl-3-methyl-5-hydroxy-6-metoxy-1,4-benzoquinol methylase